MNLEFLKKIDIKTYIIIGLGIILSLVIIFRPNATGKSDYQILRDSIERDRQAHRIDIQNNVAANIILKNKYDSIMYLNSIQRNQLNDLLGVNTKNRNEIESLKGRLSNTGTKKLPPDSLIISLRKKFN